MSDEENRKPDQPEENALNEKDLKEVSGGATHTKIPVSDAELSRTGTGTTHQIARPQ